MGKYSNVFSSTKWRLGEKVVLWLMKCLCPAVSFDKFMNNNFTSFCQLTLLELRTFEQHVCSTKICYANVLSLETNSCEKRNFATLDSVDQAKNLCNFRAVGSFFMVGEGWIKMLATMIGRRRKIWLKCPKGVL